MRLLTVVAVVAAFVGGTASAREVQPGIFQVAAKSEVKIDRHLTCRVIKNNSNNPVMVPTRTAEEWSSGTSSFLTNISNMPGVTATSCLRSFNSDSEYNFVCGSGIAQVCADRFSGWLKHLGQTGVPFTALTIRQIGEEGLVFSNHVLMSVPGSDTPEGQPAVKKALANMLDPICANTDLVPKDGLYATRVWDGTGSDPYMLSAVYDCR